MTEPDTAGTTSDELTVAELRREQYVEHGHEWIARLRQQIHDLNDDDGDS